MNRTLRFARTASHFALVAAALGTGLVACDTTDDTGTYVGYETGVDPATCPGGAPKLVDGRPATWTVIHYAAADNNLEDVLIEDIDEMELGHRGSENVNVIVQLDKYSEDGAWRYEVKGDSEEGLNSPVVWSSEEELDTGDWRTLRDYGKWAVTCYPAENYIVVIGGHGGGWSSSDHNRSASLSDRAAHHRAKREGEALRVIAPDDSHHTEMYVDELAQALAEIKDATERPGDPSYQNRLVAYGSDALSHGHDRGRLRPAQRPDLPHRLRRDRARRRLALQHGHPGAHEPPVPLRTASAQAGGCHHRQVRHLLRSRWQRARRCDHHARGG